MQVNETVADGLKREYTITVPAGDIEELLLGRLAEIGKTIRMPGFRPGKVPVGLLRKMHGKSVMGEVLERTIGDSSQATITERGLRPVTQPKIEITKFEEGKDLEYTMAFELFPEFEPVDLSTIELERLKAPVDEERIEDAIKRIAESFKDSKTVEDDRACAAGDIVVIDFVGRLDGEEFPGGKAEGYSLELGTGAFIPGFEDQIVGAKKGEHREFEVTFPDDYPAENLKGKTTTFSVDVKELRETVPAAIDDELAKKMGLESLEDLRQKLREEQEAEIAKFARTRMKTDLLDALDEAHEFPIPPGMVDAELESIWSQFEEARKANPDSVAEEDRDKDDETLKEEYRAIAERRVRLGLLLTEIGRINNIEVTSEEVNRALMNHVRQFPGQEKEVLDYYRNHPEAAEALRAPVLEEKVVDFIIELAKITDRDVTLDELLNESPDADAKNASSAKDESKSKKKSAASGGKKSKSAAEKAKETAAEGEEKQAKKDA
jgi:trigger factor